jgi:hypothetical protein
MAETYFGDLSVGDKIVYEGEAATIVEIDSQPLTEDDYYGPAKPDYLYFTIRFGDDPTCLDVFARWESDTVPPNVEG